MSDTRKSGPEIRSERVRGDVRATLEAIRSEINASGGVYPKGKLTIAEIVRRSGASRNTVKDMDEVQEFLEAYNKDLSKPDSGRSVPKPDHIRKLNEYRKGLAIHEADRLAILAKLEQSKQEINRLNALLAERDAIIEDLRVRVDPKVRTLHARDTKGYWDD